MRSFAFSRAIDFASLPERAALSGKSNYVAGGTTLLDLVKLNVMQPGEVIDITRLPLSETSERADGGLRIGTLVRNSTLAWDHRVRARYPVLAEALLSGASPQIRNMATTGGNILQRTRCPYFRDNISLCNKREPGSGCAALDGYNRSHAVLGGSDACVATHPSDLCVALAALEADVIVRTQSGERRIAFDDFHLLPGSTPHRENVLEPGELIVAVELPPPHAGARSWYLKTRDRESYEFALASAAVILRVENGVIKFVRIALGGVGAKPWRCRAAEALLEGTIPSPEIFQSAARAIFATARPLAHNAFKVPLAQRVLVHVLTLLLKDQPAVRHL
jgi:xanthine dehydrogenase YagS FAD-binding subunit